MTNLSQLSVFDDPRPSSIITLSPALLEPIIAPGKRNPLCCLVWGIPWHVCILSPDTYQLLERREKSEKQGACPGKVSILIKGGGELGTRGRAVGLETKSKGECISSG